MPLSDGIERNLVTLVVISVILAGIGATGDEWIGLNDDGEIVVRDCLYASVWIYGKWHIEDNDTYVFNTSAWLGYDDDEVQIDDADRIVAHVIVSEDIFNAYNESDLMDGWLCNDDMMTIDEWIDQRLITIIEGKVPWQIRDKL